MPVRAEIAQLDTLSAHADKDELVLWARGFHRPPSQIFVVHGESEASRALQMDLLAELGWNASIPKQDETKSIL